MGGPTQLWRLSKRPPWRGLVALLMLPSLAGAAAAAGDTAVQGTEGQKARLEEIVVTAQKRSEKLSRVPISITALGKAQMDKQGVRNVSDVARLVPGLHLQTSDVLGDTNISIRGIVSNTGAETTGVYIDETPVQARQEIVFSNPYPEVFDLDRVEVLRGPQGTLFGAGSEGGTIRFITPAPSLQNYTGYFRSEVGYTDGGDPSYELGGAVGGPIVPDKLGFRVSLWDRVDGGYIDRVNPVTDELSQRNANDANSTVARAALLLQATDDLTIEPAVFFQRLHNGDRDYSWETAPPNWSQPAPNFTEYAQIPQPSNDTYILPSLEIGYDFGDFTAKSITSYFRRVVDDQFDATSYELSGLLPGSAISLPTDPDYLSIGDYHQKQSDWTQEVRLASTDQPDSRFSWVFGVYFQNNVSSNANSFAEPFDKVAYYLSTYDQVDYGPYCSPGSNSYQCFGEAPVGGKYSYLQHITVLETDIAGFGNFTYQPLPGLKFSVGLRVAHSKYSYNDFQDGPYGPAAPTYYSGSKGELPVTPRFAVSYQINPEQMVYATAAKGYRIGGANESVLGVPSCVGDLAALGLKDVPHTFNSDSVWSYEVGDKGSYFGGKLRVDASLFWINWSAIQQQVLLPDCGYYYTDNLGNATSKGFDLQADWLVTPTLTLSTNMGLTDVRYTTTVKQYVPDAPQPYVILAEAGNSLATPEWTTTVSAQQDFDLPMDASGYVRVDDQFAGAYYRTGNADTFSYDPNTRDAPKTNFMSLRAGAKKAGWDVSLFVNNVLNSQVSLYRYQDTVSSPGLRDTTYRPLTVGVTAIKKF
jgi:outer membrane receptor protein involved in Fe transport